MKTFAQWTVAGVIGLVLLKLLLGALGMVVGFVGLAFKLALITLLGYVVLRVIRGRREREV